MPIELLLEQEADRKSVGLVEQLLGKVPGTRWGLWRGLCGLLFLSFSVTPSLALARSVGLVSPFSTSMMSKDSSVMVVHEGQRLRKMFCRLARLAKGSLRAIRSTCVPWSPAFLIVDRWWAMQIGVRSLGALPSTLAVRIKGTGRLSELQYRSRLRVGCPLRAVRDEAYEVQP